MKKFAELIRKALPNTAENIHRQWIFVPYDRLTATTGPLLTTPAKECGVILVESMQKNLSRRYHKKKLALLLSNARHFALEQAERGVKVIYVQTREDFGTGLREAQDQYGLGEILTMTPAERELRIDLADAVKAGLRLREVEDTTWMSTVEDFDAVFGRAGRKSYVMDRFYRAMREKTGLLMRRGKPAGGKFSHDADNRRPYKHEVAVPHRLRFAPDSITLEVMEGIEREFSGHFGNLEGFDLPVTAADCERAWKFALDELLPHFGPFEDAMVKDEPDLFHSRMSALINIGRLLPANVVGDVERAYEEGRVPLASAEGFIRQILGWREFMRHLHRATDGYRGLNVPYDSRTHASARYGGAAPNALDATLPLPAVYWGSRSGMHCMDTVVGDVIREGWSHHITRLMVLSNLATLCGFSPRELTDWFWIAYIDAYDWVVEPNVLGMSTYADGGVTATKPYVSGSAYINKMSDYCKGCRFDPKQSIGENSCPFTALYWTFLERNQERLGRNPRLTMPYATLRKKTPADKEALRARAESAIAALKSQKY